MIRVKRLVIGAISTILAVSLCFMPLWAEGAGVDSLRVVITSLPEDTPADLTLFLSGPFNDWASSDSAAMFRKQADGRLVADVATDGTPLLYYVSAGLAGLIEGDGHGKPQGGRLDSLSSAREQSISIVEWLNPQRHHLTSARRHVRPIPLSLAAPKLGVRVSASVYMPPRHVGGMKYPVVYMLCGDRAFDEYADAGGEWRIDEVLDSLFERRGLAVVVVAVNLPQRVSSDFYQRYNAEGKELKPVGQLADFMLSTLHDFIVSHYPVLGGRDNVYVVSSGRENDLGMTLLLDGHRQVGGGTFFLRSGLLPWHVQRVAREAKRRSMQQILMYLPHGVEDSLAMTFQQVGRFGENELRVAPLDYTGNAPTLQAMGQAVCTFLMWVSGRAEALPGFAVEEQRAEDRDSVASR